jgi:putative redox protein
MSLSKIKISSASAKIETVPFKTEISMGKHIIIADEPIEEGGTDLGANPHELLIGALVSCTCFTIKMYAQRKQWPLQSVVAEAEIKRETESGKQTTTVTQFVTFTGDLNDEQTQRLLEIADKCPVHKTLAPAMTMLTLLKATVN